MLSELRNISKNIPTIKNRVKYTDSINNFLLSWLFATINHKFLERDRDRLIGQMVI